MLKKIRPFTFGVILVFYENGKVNGLVLHQKGDHIGKRIK
jgi:hypothetical protein